MALRELHEVTAEIIRDLAKNLPYSVTRDPERVPASDQGNGNGDDIGNTAHADSYYNPIHTNER